MYKTLRTGLILLLMIPSLMIIQACANKTGVAETESSTKTSQLDSSLEQDFQKDLEKKQEKERQQKEKNVSKKKPNSVCFGRLKGSLLLKISIFGKEVIDCSRKPVRFYIAKLIS
jgi:hypothetical protein